MPGPYENPCVKNEFLPTLQEVLALEKPRDVPKEAAWIWGEGDEVRNGDPDDDMNPVLISNAARKAQSPDQQLCQGCCCQRA